MNILVVLSSKLCWPFRPKYVVENIIINCCVFFFFFGFVLILVDFYRRSIGTHHGNVEREAMERLHCRMTTTYAQAFCKNQGFFFTGVNQQSGQVLVYLSIHYSLLSVL